MAALSEDQSGAGGGAGARVDEASGGGTQAGWTEEEPGSSAGFVCRKGEWCKAEICLGLPDNRVQGG